MKKSILLMSTLSILSACNNGSGGSGSGVPALSEEDQLKQAASVTDYSTVLKPNKFTVVKANLSWDEQKERYTLGCMTPGESKYNNLMDPQLKPGMSFKTKNIFQWIKSAAFKTTEERNIISVNASKVQYEKNYLELDLNYLSDMFPELESFDSIDKIYSKMPHEIDETEFVGKDYYVHSNNKTIETNLTSSFQNVFQNIKNSLNVVKKITYCYPKYETIVPEKTTSTVDKISYDFNGKTVIAYLVKSKSEYKSIVCSESVIKFEEDSSSAPMKNEKLIDIGPGTEEGLTIFSNDIVENGMLNCGGTNVYSTNKYSLTNQKIIESNVQKILSAPLR